MLKNCLFCAMKAICQKQFLSGSRVVRIAKYGPLREPIRIYRGPVRLGL